ncbi:DUF4846 domain-containing protein [Corallococcus sp. M34]|nr:DUF4846 domain-containing protein [Citreicoccus inhibens]
MDLSVQRRTPRHSRARAGLPPRALLLPVVAPVDVSACARQNPARQPRAPLRSRCLEPSSVPLTSPRHPASLSAPWLRGVARQLSRLGLVVLCATGASAGAEEVVPRAPTREERARYPWLGADVAVRPLDVAIAPPEGYARVAVEPGSFGAWLRGLPLRPAGTPARDFRGGRVLAGDDARLAAVAELDVGTANLQQCADSIIRLHAEWRWASGHSEQIAYRFTSGHLASWPRYAAGDRARVSGSKVTWVRGASADSSRSAFRSYLDLVFTYAGTLSLQGEKARPARADVRPGDFFVLGGSPGHAVLVLDVAANARGERVALLGQGFIPAQDFQVLSPGAGGPWFSLSGDTVATPFWQPFPWSSLRRMPSP